MGYYIFPFSFKFCFYLYNPFPIVCKTQGCSYHNASSQILVNLPSLMIKSSFFPTNSSFYDLGLKNSLSQYFRKLRIEDQLQQNYFDFDTWTASYRFFIVLKNLNMSHCKRQKSLIRLERARL